MFGLASPGAAAAISPRLRSRPDRVPGHNPYCRLRSGSAQFIGVLVSVRDLPRPRSLEPSRTETSPVGSVAGLLDGRQFLPAARRPDLAAGLGAGELARPGRSGSVSVKPDPHARLTGLLPPFPPP